MEKLLKAFLVARGHPFEMIHDLRALTNECAKLHAGFATLRDRIGPLTAYAVRFRYPGPADPTVEQVREALEVVEALTAFLAPRLPMDVFPGP